LVIAIVYVVELPAFTLPAPSVFEIDRSAEFWLTVVVVVDESFVGFGSEVPVEVAVAVFERTVPFAVAPLTVTMIVIVTVAPTARLGTVQLMVEVPVQLPPGTVAETSVVPAGIVSETLTPLEVVPVDAVLLFVATIVYVRLLPAITGSGLSLFASPMSARPRTVVVVLAELFAEFGSAGDEPLAKLAVLLMTEPLAVFAGTVPVTVMVAVPALFKAPIGQVIGAVPEQVPEPPGVVFVNDPLTPVRREGIVSVTLMPVALLGPLFVTTMV
jgi:hypothetical protein